MGSLTPARREVTGSWRWVSQDGVSQDFRNISTTPHAPEQNEGERAEQASAVQPGCLLCGGCGEGLSPLAGVPLPGTVTGTPHALWLGQAFSQMVFEQQAQLLGIKH